MLSDVEAAVTSQAGVLEQADSVDLPFVKSGAGGALEAAGIRKRPSDARSIDAVPGIFGGGLI